jgi:hypothetical protein
MQHLEAPSTMRRIENTKKLNLHKETLRTISRTDLEAVAGGSQSVIQGTLVTCGTGCAHTPGNGAGSVSMVGLGSGCSQHWTLNPTWQIDPAPEIPIIVGMP